MRSPRKHPVRPLAFAALAALTAGAAGAPSDDPLASEIARWQTFVATHQSSGEIWKDVQQSTRPALAEAERAVQSGQRELALRAFGDVTSVPTLLVFDREGRAAGAFFGAPPTLHADVEARLATLLE